MSAYSESNLTQAAAALAVHTGREVDRRDVASTCKVLGIATPTKQGTAGTQKVVSGRDLAALLALARDGLTSTQDRGKSCM